MSNQTLQNQEELYAIIHNLILESWRAIRLFEKILSKLDAGEKHRYISQLNWFRKKIDDALLEINCKLVNLEGEIYDVGMAATPINLNEFTETDKLVVDQMLEPIIIGEAGIIKTGTIILKKVD